MESSVTSTFFENILILQTIDVTTSERCTRPLYIKKYLTNLLQSKFIQSKGVDANLYVYLVAVLLVSSIGNLKQNT